MKKNNHALPIVTVGIPAYNEEANIVAIISCVLNQVCESYVLDKIIVSSDGSTDKTVELVNTIKDPRITVLNHTSRKGLAENQNSILSAAKSDVVVLIQADTIIADTYFIEKLIAPIVQRNADLTSCKLTALSPQNYFEKILYVSMLCKNAIFDTYNGGDNLYTCHGPVRAFSKKLYTAIKFKENIGEDAYTYLYCKHHGFNYEYVPTTEIFYRLPDNFSDHEKQSRRLFQSPNNFFKEFPSLEVARAYSLPMGLSIKSFIYSFIRHPIEMIAYVALVALIKTRMMFAKTTATNWEASVSSKVLFKRP